MTCQNVGLCTGGLQMEIRYTTCDLFNSPSLWLKPLWIMSHYHELTLTVISVRLTSLAWTSGWNPLFSTSQWTCSTEGGYKKSQYQFFSGAGSTEGAKYTCIHTHTPHDGGKWAVTDPCVRKKRTRYKCEWKSERPLVHISNVKCLWVSRNAHRIHYYCIVMHCIVVTGGQ